jgi:Caspase domain/Putative peptidoglycan binding domain
MRSQGEDVQRLQTRLNQVGNFGLAIDGFFGSATRNAVVRFQRNLGLSDDGIAGPTTLAALGLTDEPAAAQPSTPTKGRRLLSLHIGVNRVDPARYEGWDGKLNGCENDARTIAAIAERDGFTTMELFTAQATTTNVLSAISAVASQLTRGDVFLLSYAGHGGQVPNVSGDDEVDQQDETWVLYDRMVLDDELEHAFSKFAAGVDIVLLSDSCHSGTIARQMFDPVQLECAERKQAYYQGLTTSSTSPGGTRSFPIPAFAASRGGPTDEAAEEQRSLFAKAASEFSYRLKFGSSWSSTGYVSIFDRFPILEDRGLRSTLSPRRFPGHGATAGGDRGPAEPVTTRNMPLGQNALVVTRQSALYSGIQESARGHAPVQASGLSISGCQDAQLSQEVGGHGVFTTTLNEAWNNSTFTGTFEEFHRAIVSRMGPTQTPVLGLWGQAPQSLAARTPFG